ncbi:transposase [Pseudomonas sp. 8 R 14]|uniref:transposase n=1 Tax=Pseudomonas sp. 8 R 14 TaxID=1844092 RepID=UPI00210F09A3|nr:transposase [Pseudomonas sp. 8 R 14]
MPKDLPDDPALLKQLLEQMLLERETSKGRIVHLEEENALLRQRLFGRKSEQTADPATPQLALFNEAESVVEAIDENAEEEVVAPAKRRGNACRSAAHRSHPRTARTRTDLRLRLPQTRHW